MMVHAAMLKRTYDWCIDAADKPYALWILAAVSFAESSFFPIPPDIMLLPMSLARPKKAWWFATVCTIASVAGGVVGYAIGALLYDSVGQWLINLYGLSDKVETFRASYAEWGAVIILLKGLTPIPYKLVTITSGFAGYNIWLFILCSIVARGGRFFVVAVLLNRYGDLDPERTGKAARPLGRHRRRRAGARFRHRVQADLTCARALCRHPGFRLRSLMSDRIGHLFTLSGTQFATAGLARPCWRPPPKPPGRRRAASPRSACSRRPSNRCRLSLRRSRSSRQPPRDENPGLINEIGKLFEKSKSLLPPLKSPSETIDDFNARTKDAGQSLSNMAKPSIMVSGRAACLVSANGAPDCKAGADKLCQSKGYKEGKSLDTDAAEKCSPKVFLPGHKRQPGDCKTENYVTRALCQ